jgi:hypothetical protein
MVRYGLAFSFRFDSYEKQNEKLVRDFFREMIMEEKLQIGYIGCLVTVPNHHGHYAVCASKEKEGELLEIDKRKWRNKWAEMSGQTINALFIEDITDSEKWTNYIDKNIREDVDSTMVWYNKKLLNRR